MKKLKGILKCKQGKTPLILFICLLLLISGVKPQTTPINFSRLTNQEGLSQATVNVIHKDKQGFLWVGTDDGLNRFNGKQVEKFYSNYTDNNSLASNQIYGIAEDGKGKLFFGHNDAGITSYDKERKEFTRITANQSSNSLSNDKVYGLTFLTDGYLWARTVTGISKVNPANFAVTNYDDFAYTDRNISFNIDIVEQNSYVWFGSRNKGLLRIRKNGVIVKDSLWDCKRYGYTVTGIAAAGNEFLWVASEKGLFKVYTSNANYIIEPWFLSTTLFATENKILIDNDNKRIWIGTSDKGLLLIDQHDKNNYTQITSTGITDNLLNNGVNFLLKDQEKTVFIGTGRGVNFYSPYTSTFNNYQNIFRNITNFGHPVYSIHELENKQLLLGNLKGVHLFDPVASTVQKIPFNPINDSSLIIYKFVPISNKTILLCTGKGIFELHNNSNRFTIKGVQLYKELRSLENVAITNIKFINDSIAYISSYYHGIYKWNYKEHYLKQFNKLENKEANSKQPVDSRVANIVLTKDNRMVLCTKGGFSLFDLKTETFENFAPGKSGGKEFVGKNVKDAFDDGTHIWITTFGQGLQLFNKKNRTFSSITTADNLPNNAVYAILDDGNGFFWIPTDYGLSRINRYTRKIETFYSSDGLPDNEFNGFATTKGRSRLLYFSTLNGIISVNPNSIVSNTYSAPIVLTQLTATKGTDDILFNTYHKDKFKIREGYNSLHLRFAALSYVASNKINYLVKMNGFDEDWISIGNNNEIRYSKLPHGTYTFWVKAKNSSGNFIDKPLKIIVIVKPLWFETLWFYALISAITVLAIFSLYKIRINQLTKEQKIRSRLAIDLHDDLGSTLNSIQVYTNLTIMQVGTSQPLQKIKEGTQEAIIGLRDIIWVLDDKKNTVEQMVDRICKFCSPLSEAKAIHFKKHIFPEALYHNLKPQEKRNLYLIIKEAINNVLKYAKATEASLTIQLIKGKLSVLIKDDGKGFDTALAYEGNGLINMRTRAKEIGYSFSIKGGKGTVIEMRKK